MADVRGVGLGWVGWGGVRRGAGAGGGGSGTIKIAHQKILIVPLQAKVIFPLQAASALCQPPNLINKIPNFLHPLTDAASSCLGHLCCITGQQRSTRSLVAERCRLRQGST